MVENVNIQQRSLNIRFDEERRLWPVTLHYTEIYINKIQQDATVRMYLFTAKSLYMFRVSIAPIIRST